MITADDIQRIEDDAELAAMTEPICGLPAWLLLRNYFHRAVIESLVYAGAIYPRYALPYRPVDLLKAASLSVLHNVLTPATPTQTLILGSGAGVIDRGGMQMDRLTSYFADALGDRAWTEQSVHLFDSRYALRRPRLTLTAHRRLFDHAWARLSVGKDHQRLAAALIDRATELTRDRLDCRLDDSIVLALKRRGAVELAAATRVAARVDQMLRVHRPRLVIADQSSYGTKAYFNALCHAKGISVIEYQHGVITRAHEAYNLGPAFLTHRETRRALPDVIMTYGAWWSTQINLPVDKVVVGNPHRDAALGSHGALGKDGGTVLILGDGVETEFYESFCEDVARSLPSRSVVFRPHPVERGRALERHGQRVRPYVLDSSPDIYDAFRDAQWVVSEVSTGLFEVAGTAAVPVVIDTKKSRFYLPDSPFIRIRDAQELSNLVCSNQVALGSRDSTIWATDWQRRFMALVDTTLRESAADSL